MVRATEIHVCPRFHTLPNTMLQGKWCLVTGASRGIGKAIALQFAKEGASIALTARSAEQLEKVKEECLAGGAQAVELHAVDLSSSESVESLATELLGAHGCVDVLVNNAGAVSFEDVFEGNPDQWEKMMALNVNAPMRLTHRLTPVMKEKGEGVIINMGSLAAVNSFAGTAAYSASKHAVRGWSLSCADAMRPHGIKVMLINPAFVRTAMTEHEMHDSDAMMDVKDVAEACMLPFKVSSDCNIKEILLTEMRQVIKAPQ